MGIDAEYGKLVMSAARLLVNIDVDDLVRGELFYTSAFGLQVGRRIPGATELIGLDAPFYLLEKPQGTHPVPGLSTERTYHRHWTPVHLDIIVPDLGTALERAVRAGAVPEGQVRSEIWGHIVALADPFGHGICLIEWIGRGYDEIPEG